MRASRTAWQEFDRWNEAIAEVSFPEVDVPMPVYLDLEDDVIERIAAKLGIAPRGFEARLANVVAQTVDFSSTSNALEEHVKRVHYWRDRDRRETYPELATLAVFSLAAEQMAHGDGMTASNYYGRLANLIGGEPSRLGQSVRTHSETLWAGLNLWLTSLDGRRGTPTAFSIGLRFVGLPMSQALIREADRRLLERFFVDFDLAPRSEIPAHDLEPLLSSWFARGDSTSHLARLWGKTGLRSRIAEVAAVKLQSWDGLDASDGSGGQPRGRTLLVLQRNTFAGKQIRLYPFFFVKDAESPRTVSIVTELGDVETLLEPVSGLPRTMAFSDRGIVDSGSLLEGVLHVKDHVTGEITRRPQAVVVFRKDDLSGLWLEARQVLMGDDVLILASGRAVATIREILGEIARPGWRGTTERKGLPPGWTLFEGVEIFSRPSNEEKIPLDSRALIPLTSSQLKLAGGLALPGVMRNRWHAGRPPEVRAVHEGGAPFSLRLIDLDAAANNEDDKILDTWDDAGTGSIVQSLADHDLEDGDYALEMVSGKTVLSRREFSLHSSNAPDELQWGRVEPIEHDLGDPLSALGAGSAASGSCIVQGAIVALSEVADGRTSEAPNRAWWKPARDHDRTRAVTLKKPDPMSCFYTGAHRFTLPDVRSYEAYRAKGNITGTCETCGLQQQSPANYYRARATHNRKKRHLPAATVNVTKLPPVGPEDEEASERSWDIALDALRYVGGGPISSLERIARYFDSSRTFINEFIGTFEALGHIEVQREPATLAPVRWEIAPTMVVDTGDERVFTGYWPPSLVGSAQTALNARGFSLTHERIAGGPSRLATVAADKDLRTWLELGAEHPGRAGKDLADHLPPLSAVVNALPRLPATTVTEAQWFDPTQAAWVASIGADGVGAFRVGRYRAMHYIRTQADVEAGTWARGNVYLAKHMAAAALARKPLLAYSETQRALIVPLGALLPGMYERAIVMDSGYAPQRVRSNHVYRGVSLDLAARITYLLEN
ncbi:hypothetical protein [Georgenia daeguensis]|uniref:Uncharacterized protein n=1 Tax=Georgenia daeguensis TaxID=908355 RepID=A0ABP6UPZ3_9MICO